MNATLTDDRRRLVMPPELPARSAVTVQQIDEDTWLVKRQRADKKFIMVLFPDVPRLPDDPEWEKVEAAFTQHAIKNLAPFEE